ncbi:MAG: ATP-binding protein [Ginsengibacter sp.]
MTKSNLQILLKDLQALPKECEWVEFKVNNSRPEDIGEYISALSNSACYHKKEYGFLVFGIENESHRFLGTKFKPSTEKIGNQELENWLATQLNPRIDFNIFEFEYHEMNFALFRIHTSTGTPVSFKGKAYIRIGTYKKPLSEHPEKERQIWSSNKHYHFEKEIAANNLSEDEVLNLIDYPGFFELFQIALPDNRRGIIDKLKQEKVIKEVHKEYSITNLGGILFAKNINEFEYLARKALRVIIYDGTNKIESKKEQLGKRGYAVGFKGLIRFIEDKLPSKEIIEKALRKKITVYPILAIRELVANALIHQDFSLKGSSAMVEIFNDRIEITNPGKPIIDPLRFVDHSPESRNEILARVMRRLNICEERGSGIDKVIFECEKNGLPAPEIIVGDNYTRIILYGNKNLNEMKKQDKIRSCYLHSCLKYVNNEPMTNQTVRARFSIQEVNAAIASRIIRDTVDAKLIKLEDPESSSRKFTRYIPFWA